MSEGLITTKQMKALHLGFEQMAQMLNDAGLDMKKVLKPSVDIPWTKLTVKEYLWRPIMQAYTRKGSTAALTTKETVNTWDVLNRHLGENLGIHQPFPSIEELIRKQDIENK